MDMSPPIFLSYSIEYVYRELLIFNPTFSLPKTSTPRNPLWYKGFKPFIYTIEKWFEIPMRVKPVDTPFVVRINLADTPFVIRINPVFTPFVIRINPVLTPFVIRINPVFTPFVARVNPIIKP
jgi:hypothetical protein